MITKYIPGVLIGAVIASAAFLLLDRSRDDKNPASSELVQMNTESQAIGVDGGRMPSDSGERNFPANRVVQSSEPLEDAGKNVSLLNGVPCSACLPPDEALPPPDLPIHLPREFEYLRRYDTFRRFERRPVDPIWSPQAEIQLSNYFAQNQEFASIYGIPTIQCRATVCMALFTAPGFLDHARNYPDPKLASYGASSIFRADFKGFFDDPVAKQFNPKEVLENMDGHIQDGVATFYLLLPKLKPDSHAEMPNAPP
jgi:hypothetical protein